MRLLLTACLCLSLIGCSSIGDMVSGHGSRHQGQRVFGGTRWNVDVLEGEEVITHTGAVEKIFAVIDFPFSFGMDIVFLPVTVIVSIFRPWSLE